MTSKSIYQCEHCFRNYKLKIYYDRHITACELLCKGKKQRSDEINNSEIIPDNKKLFELIIALSIKNKELEEKVIKLTKHIDIKKRVPIKEWLETNYKKVITFESFMLNKTITVEDYNYLCKNGYVEGMIMILKNLFPQSLCSQLPIKAFNQKDNTLFIKNEEGWTIMTTIELEGIISTFGKQLMTYFVEWQESNKHRLTEDNYIEEYMTILQKIIGCKSESVLLKIKRGLYKHVKINLDNHF